VGGGQPPIGQVFVVGGALLLVVVGVVGVLPAFRTAVLICFGRESACFFVSAIPSQFVSVNPSLQTIVAVGATHTPIVESARAMTPPRMLGQTTSVRAGMLSFCFHRWESGSLWVVSFTPLSARTVFAGINVRFGYLTP
jgi:hypothetical protein